MATVSVPTASQRAAAEALLADPGRGSPGRSKETGRSFWLVRGSQGRSYFTTADGCSCPGYRHRGVCSHSLAAAMRDQQPAPVESRGRAMARLRAELGMVEA